MIVLVDIGNSRTKLVKSDNTTFLEALSLSNEQLVTFDLVSYVKGAEEIILASVNSVTLNSVFELVASSLDIPCTFVKTDAAAFGIKNSYPEYHKLGVDRWLAVLGAAKLFPKQNVLVVDSGTATTVDLVAANGEHVGGWITPGIDLMHQSLQLNTENISTDKQTIISTSFGQNTADCVDYGCWAVLAATVEQAAKEAEKLNYPVDNILLTGGNSAHITPFLTIKSSLEPNLVFIGLLRYKRS